MQPHEERVVTEQKDLAENIVKLRTFIQDNPLFKELPIDEQARLKTQEFLMTMYWRVLGDRIAEFHK